MQALPRNLSSQAGKQATGIVCPDCHGALSVEGEGGRPYLRFECRIGHVYSEDELVAAKERELEDILWTAVTRMEELAQVFEDLRRFPERAVWLRHASATHRRLLEQNEPADLGSGAVEPADTPP